MISLFFAALLSIGTLASVGEWIASDHLGYLSYRTNERTVSTNQSITFDWDKEVDAQIAQIVFSIQCRKSYPCQHNCTLIFANGQSIDAVLDGHRAWILTHAVNRNKVTYNQEIGENPVDHFKVYDQSNSDPISAKQVIANILKANPNF